MTDIATYTTHPNEPGAVYKDGIIYAEIQHLGGSFTYRRCDPRRGRISGPRSQRLRLSGGPATSNEII